MTNYGDADDLAELYSGLADDVDSTLKTLLMNLADAWVNRKIANMEVEPSADILGEAANYYAMSLLLHKVYDTDEVVNPTAVWYEGLAKEALGLSDGSEDGGDIGSGGNYYVSSLTVTDSQLSLRNQTRRKPLKYTTDVPSEYGR